MKPQIKKPLQGRNRNNSNNNGNNAQGQPVDPNKPVVPRMLRRLTKQSFMDVDLQYLMKLDPSTPDPFENSSPLLSDPPSLFRPLPPVAAAAAAIAQGAAGPWMFHDAARLQKEQEDLRVQYLQFLHNLNQTNPHGFLVHMNTFATEFPQEFVQLQSYIKFQESVTAQQQEEKRKQEEMRQYQLELERRNQHEQELLKFQKYQEHQAMQEQAREQQELLQEWLVRRQQQRASTLMVTKDLDLADVFTLAMQKDPGLIERTTAAPGGLSLLLTPHQQFEFGQFVQQRQLQELQQQEDRKKKLHQQLSSAGFSPFAFGAGSSPSTANPFAMAGNSSSNSGLMSATATNTMLNSLVNPIAFSQFQSPLSNEQYLQKTSRPHRGSKRY
ncbi:hypothetical protein CPC16_011911 [Podila verticillata]|nr:hypothetical protein BGZ52_009259 [Haplosporangium bisporale]KAF9211850.1 hypothetical protein BGZ59_007547 [Podila verticillata]KAF9377283.1 hypothetical protein CPC16_011911 [Podila verticillata]KAI9242671.1 MAG: hypothetical protein BYD32DRAFT_403036 [Podila humilis]KFH67537.1 hypothetical protein MVEG_06269 [Podila verticillata NRRL 6337]